jgi:hypothetical protein
MEGGHPVTAPTQPPDPRVERIAKALAANKLSLITSVALARVLVEELGGRDANVAATEIDPRIVGWMDVCKTLDDVDPTWSTRYNSTDAAIMAIRELHQTAKDSQEISYALRKDCELLVEGRDACRAQQRENAETIKALKERAFKAQSDAATLRARLRVLVEELGGREGETAKDLPSWYRLTWDKITDALTSIDPEWYHSRKDIGTHAADTIRTLAAQQRENAETIAALKGELKLARADRDFWKDEHNKACELAGQRAAELDAIKGAQPSDTDIVQVMNRLMQKFRSLPMAYDSPMARAYVEAVRSLLSAPALPVVGEMKVAGDRVLLFFGEDMMSLPFIRPYLPQGTHELCIRTIATPLPTEGGK